MALSLLYTLESIAAPCSVNAYGVLRLRPPQVEITNCDFKCKLLTNLEMSKVTNCDYGALVQRTKDA